MSTTENNSSSESVSTGTPEFLLADIKTAAGKVLQSIVAMAKTFKSTREGFFAQIPPFVHNGKVYGGQVQIWEKSTSK